MSTTIKITFSFVPDKDIDREFFPKHYIVNDGAYIRTFYPSAYKNQDLHLKLINKIKEVIKTYGTNLKDSVDRLVTTAYLTKDNYETHLKPLLDSFDKGYLLDGLEEGGSRRRRRPSRKYKKSAKRVFRKKSRSTRRR